MCNVALRNCHACDNRTPKRRVSKNKTCFYCKPKLNMALWACALAITLHSRSGLTSFDRSYSLCRNHLLCSKNDMFTVCT